MNIAVIIPALNEENAIGLVVRELQAALNKQRESAGFIKACEIIVADNGSDDRTAELAREAGATVVLAPRRGYGSACLAGLAALRPEVEVIVFMDGDHSDFPEDLPLLLRPLQDDSADFVLGRRVPVGDGALTPQQKFGNALAGRLVLRLYGFRYHDLGPFRAVRRQSLEKLRMKDRAFGWTIEMQIKAIRARLRIREVPVRYRARIGTSKISGSLWGSWSAGRAILWTIFKYTWES